MLSILPIDTGRYGTKEMLDIFKEQKKIDYQLDIEAAAALSQSEIGLIPISIARDISKIAKSGKITAKRIKQLEAKSDHDTAALVEALAEKCNKESRPWIHYGLTSNDLVDTSNSMQMRDAIKIIQPKVSKLSLLLSKNAIKHRGIPAVGRTHGQHASIISFGLKFANWAAEMSTHLERLDEIKKRVLICKTLGVVGTGSLMGKNAVKVQARVAKKLGLYPAKVTTQIIPREHFKKGQMGSSAVPTKRNPIKSERISSLSKLLRSQINTSFENIPLWHERDLSNSANERFTLPITSILLDEMLETMIKIIGNLQVNTKRVQENLHITKGQIFAEFVLEALIKKGIPRFKAYRDVQRVAFAAHKKGINFMDALENDKVVSSALSNKEIKSIFVAQNHLGASLTIIDNVNKHVKEYSKKFS